MAFLQSTGTKLLIILLNAATGIISARALRPAGRGELAAMILWNVLLANAFTLGLPSALTFQLRRRPERRSELLGAALLLCVAGSLIAITVGLFGIPHWIPQYSHLVILYSQVFLLNVPIFTAQLICRAALESDGDFTTSNLSLAVGPALTLTGLLTLLAMHRFSPLSAAWIYVGASVPSLIFVMRRVYILFRPSIRLLAESARALMSYGIRSYGIDLCGTMAFYIDQALVIHLLAPQVMGSYVVALSLSRMLNAFHTAVAMVLLPRIVSQDPAVILDLTGKAVRITTMLTATSGLVIAVFGPQLLILLYGRQYAGATGVVRILVVEVVLSGVAFVLSQAFMAFSRPGFVTLLQALGLLLTIPLMLVLIPRLGVVGAATALLISTTVRLVCVALSFKFLLHLPCPRFIASREDASLVATSLRQLARRDFRVPAKQR